VIYNRLARTAALQTKIHFTMAQSNKNGTFVPVFDAWACEALTIEHRFVLGVIHSFYINKKSFYLSINQFAKKYHISPRTYRRRLDELFDMGLIKHTSTIATGWRVIEIDYCELDFLTKKSKKESASNDIKSNATVSNETPSKPNITPDALNDFINSTNFDDLDY